MKNILILLLGLLLSYSGFSQTQIVGDTVISNNKSKLKVKVYYFHVKERCHTCYAIEENFRKTLFTYFQTELDNGIIDMYIVNCELPENQVLVKKYDAYGSTFAITPYKDGIDMKTIELSNWAYQKVNKPEVFVAELKSKIIDLISK